MYVQRCCMDSTNKSGEVNKTLKKYLGRKVSVFLNRGATRPGYASAAAAAALQLFPSPITIVYPKDKMGQLLYKSAILFSLLSSLANTTILSTPVGGIHLFSTDCGKKMVSVHVQPFIALE